MPGHSSDGGPGAAKPNRRLKREARAAYVDAVPGADVFMVAIVFRGGWVDGMAMRKGFGGSEDLEGWLCSLAYFEELHGVAIGGDLLELLGCGGVDRVAAWLEGKGKRVMPLALRNAKQAGVIMEGLRSYAGKAGVRPCSGAEDAASRR